MSTEAISPLRQRMIEDMKARKLGAHTQRGHIRSCRGSPRFSSGLLTRPQSRTSAAFSCTWPRPA